jgi:general stress protein 26
MGEVSDDSEGTQAKFFELLRSFDTAMLVTGAAEVAMRARPMAIADLADDGTIWFLTSRSSAKVGALDLDPSCALVLQRTGCQISVTGLASVVEDRHQVERLWTDSMRTWFPEGPSDPDVVALAVTPVEGEYWDNRGLSPLKFFANELRTLVTGEPLADDPRPHAQVHLHEPRRF